MTTSTVWFTALIHTEGSAFLTATAFAPLLQMLTRQKRQVTPQHYYENGFDLWDPTGSADHECRLTARRNHVSIKNREFC